MARPYYGKGGHNEQMFQRRTNNGTRMSLRRLRWRVTEQNEHAMLC